MTEPQITDVAEPLLVARASSLQQRRYERMTHRAHKRNFQLGVGNGVLYGVGTYLMGKSTVVPSFLSHLTTSSWVIGLVSQFESIGWYLPQLLASTFVVHRARKMPVYHLSTWIRGVCFFLIAGLTLWNPNPALLLALFITVYAVFSGGAGIGGVVFLELFAKTIPPERRGRFLSLRISISALLTATFGASLVAAVLSSGSFPLNFGWLFLTGATIATTGLLLMSNMREPRTQGLPEARGLKTQLRQGWKILSEDRRYRVYTFARMIMASWTIGVPFLVLFAQQHLKFRSVELGYFIASECIGTILGNVLWERLADRRSTKACLRGAATVSILLPLVVLGFRFLALPRMLYPIVFAFSAAVDSGTSIGGMSYLVEISPERDRATYIGLFNSLMALPCFLTIGAGILLDTFGWVPLYSLVFLLGIASYVAVGRMTLIPKHGHAE